MKYIGTLVLVVALALASMLAAAHWQAGHGWNRIGSSPISMVGWN